MKIQQVKKGFFLLLVLAIFMPVLNIYANVQIEGYTPSGISFSEMESRIDALVAEHLGQTTPGTAVVVVHDGEIIFTRLWLCGYSKRNSR